MAVPVSKDRQVMSIPSARSYSPSAFAARNGIGHSRKYATVISSKAFAACAENANAAVAASAVINFFTCRLLF